MDEIHALEVVVHHELQVERHVTVVWLKDCSHDSSTLQQVCRPFDHPRVVEKYLQELLLSRVVAVERPASNLNYLGENKQSPFQIKTFVKKNAILCSEDLSYLPCKRVVSLSWTFPPSRQT